MLASIVMPVIILGVLGLALGILLGYSAKKFAVAVDPRVSQVRECLPGANCGGCGFTGCDAYAQAAVNGAPVNKCTPGGASVAQKIAAILGREAGDVVPMVAWVSCQGTCDRDKEIALYHGTPDCRAASVLPGGGTKGCQSGCLGFGTCVSACKFNALTVHDGIAAVDSSSCVGCGACVEVCPRGVIKLVPKAQKVRVGCSNHDRGPAVKAVCSIGCIGCTMCAKLCPSKAITMENNLPVIDPEKCVACGVCVSKCPAKALVMVSDELEAQSA